MMRLFCWFGLHKWKQLANQSSVAADGATEYAAHWRCTDCGKTDRHVYERERKL